jgi:hypothetical protein
MSIHAELFGKKRLAVYAYLRGTQSSTLQHRGVDSRIVAVLTTYVESVPFKNTWVDLFPVEGTADERFGYQAQRPSGPAMFRRLNRSDG